MSSSRQRDSTAQVDGTPRRGRPPVLSEQALIDAGLHIAQEHGFEGLTMALVADELGMSTMAAYNYVPTKQALLGLVAQAVLAGVEVPDRSAGTWEERLRILASELRNSLRRFPGVIDALRGVQDDHESDRLARGVIEILRDAGFDRRESRLAFVTFYTYMIGQTRLEDPRSPVSPQPEMPLDPDKVFDYGYETMIEGLHARLRQGERKRRAQRNAR